MKKIDVMNVRSLLLFIFYLSPGNNIAQVKITQVDTQAIPASIRLTGKIVNAIRYTDSLGDHLIITTESGEVPSADREDNRDASLHAGHYHLVEDSANLSWEINDFISECPVDIATRFIPATCQVTDLDQDGLAEVWLMYKLACRGDVSPATMKLIMYENGRKSAMRGTNKVKTTETEFTGGIYSFDNSFIKGPAIFRNYASALWKKNILETWE